MVAAVVSAVGGLVGPLEAMRAARDKAEGGEVAAVKAMLLKHEGAIMEAINAAAAIADGSSKSLAEVNAYTPPLCTHRPS
jgi:hypothetical protein